MSWQNSEHEEIKKEFRDRRRVKFVSSSTALAMYPIVVLGGDDTEWVACALGKENMATSHCNHCQLDRGPHPE